MNKKNRVLEFECGKECGFFVRSHNEMEIINIAKNHAYLIHDMTNVIEEEIRERIK